MKKKKFKSDAEKLTKKFLKEGKVSYVEPINFNYEEYEKLEAAKQKEAERLEKLRIDKIKCPSCGSTNKEHVVKREDNRIIGPGFRSWITDEYFVCKDCGTRYEDITKINNG